MINPAWLTDAASAAEAALDPDCLAQVVAGPGFRNLLKPWIETWRIGAGDHGILARTVRDLGRFLASLWVIQLDATPGGLTTSRLARLLHSSGVSGPGRASSILIFLRFSGYVEAAPGREGERGKRYQPTPQMVSALRDRLLRDLHAVWPADPALLAVAPRLADPAAFRCYVAAIGEVTAASFPLYRPSGASLDVFSQRYSGMVLLAELLLSDPHAVEFPPSGQLPVTLNGLARSCQISRAQVRGILKAGQAQGLLDLRLDGSVRLQPALSAHLEMLLAGALIVTCYAARQALAANHSAINAPNQLGVPGEPINA